MSKMNFSRREFLNRTAVGSLAIATYPLLAFATPTSKLKVSASNQITVGCIGLGPEGLSVMNHFLQQPDARVLAVCDVKAEQLEQARSTVNNHYKNNDCAVYGDFHELLGRKDIDAVLIATPDHWHALHAISAARADKDIYLEKPMSLSVSEDQTLRRQVQRTKRVFQFGTQQRSAEQFKLAVELVRAGRIGKLKSISVWAPGSAPGGSTMVLPLPVGLDYDKWLGPTHYRDYTEDLCAADGAKKTWWFVSDFCLGFVAGWGIHPLDIALWGAGELADAPVEVRGRGSFHAEGICDTATIWDVDFQFGNALQMKFIGTPNGGNRGKPTGEPWLHEEQLKQRYGEIQTHGTVFEGSEGWIHVNRKGVTSSPGELCANKIPSSHPPAIGLHVRNFLDCVKTRNKTAAPIESAVRSDVFCHLADIAIRLNRKVRFDPMREQFINDNEANHRLVAPLRRKPYRI